MASTPSTDLDLGPHADSALLCEARAALDWWSRAQPSRPTSSLAGGGAIEAAEQAMSNLVLGRPALALPSATFAMLVALQAVGLQAGDDVLVSGADWPAARAVAQLLGARPVPVPVRTSDFTIDPAAVAGLVCPATRALVATHVHGLVADVAAIRRALPDEVAIIEDCAQAFCAYRSARPAGTFGDYAVFSLGPGKTVSAGEMGLLVSAGRPLHCAAVSISQHPIRQALTGIACPREDVLSGRPSPLTAIVAAYKLSRWGDVGSQLRRLDPIVRSVVANAGGTVLGSEMQRHPPGCVPIAVESVEAEQAIRDALEASFDYGAEVAVCPSGAVVDPDLEENDRANLAHALDRVRLVSVRPATVRPRR